MTTGNLVNCSWLDSIRIEEPHRALTIPAKCLLAADIVLRAAFVHFDGDMELQPVEDSEDGDVFQLQLGPGAKFDPVVYGDTPWQCFLAMADWIEENGYR